MTSILGTFQYNPAGQITAQTRTGDAYAWTGAYNVNRNYTANGLNQLTTAGSVALGYDARGNLTSSGADLFSSLRQAQGNRKSENRLLTGPQGSVLGYDPLGRLASAVSSGLGIPRRRGRSAYGLAPQSRVFRQVAENGLPRRERRV